MEMRLCPLCEGDFWGITKTSLLMGDCFNENLLGILSTLWYKINERANCYYIHEKVMIELRIKIILMLILIDKYYIMRILLKKNFI
jgi:hypothetical protein